MANKRELKVVILGEKARSVAKAAKSASKDVEDEAKRLGDRMGKHGDDSGKGFAQGLLGGLSKALKAGLKPVAATAAAGFAAQFAASAGAGLASGAKAIAQGLGSALALAPAAALAGVAAFSALKLAVSGVGDALSAGLSGDVEKFEEALDGLSPSAQRFARDVVGMRDQLDALKGTVQENFFGQFVGQIRPLAAQYLPAIERTLGGIGRAFGRAADGTFWFLGLPSTAQAVDGALLNVEAAVRNVTRGTSNMVQAFMPLVTVGSTFLPQLTAGIGRSTNSLASFMQRAERTGRLRDFIQDGIDSLRDLRATARQVGSIFGNIGSISSTVWAAMGVETGGILDTVERLTGQFDRFLQSARGSSALNTIFGSLRTVAGGFMTTVERALGILGDVLGPLMPDMLRLVEAFSRLKTVVVGVGLDALEPALHGIGAVVGGVVLPALTGLANFLATNKPLVQGIGIAIMTLLAPAFLLWAINAGLAAAATFLAMLPIILLGAAIAALAALVIIHFDTIKNAVMTAFNWVRDNWPLVLLILTGPIGIAAAIIMSQWERIKAGFTAVKDWIFGRVGDIVGFITGIPGRIMGAAASLGKLLNNALTSAKNWVKDKVDQIVDFITGIPGRIGDIGGQIMDRITGGLGNIAGSVGGFLGFDVGGVVPGPIGAPTLAVVHGGETVVPTHNPSLMRALTNDFDKGARVTGGGGGSVDVILPSAVYDQLTAAKDAITGALWRIWDLTMRAEKERYVGLRDNLWKIYWDGWRAAKERHTDLRENLWVLLAGKLAQGTFNAVGWAQAQGLSRVPLIRPMAAGGVVRHRPGGILAQIGEGGVDEAVVPLDGRHGGPVHVTNVYVQGSILSERDLIGSINRAQDKGSFIKQRGR